MELTKKERQEMQEAFESMMRAQEAIFIKAILALLQVDVQFRKTNLQQELDAHAEVMKNYSSTTFVNNIKEGFQGETATTATEMLKKIEKPSLVAPIK